MNYREPGEAPSMNTGLRPSLDLLMGSLLLATTTIRFPNRAAALLLRPLTECRLQGPDPIQCSRHLSSNDGCGGMIGNIFNNSDGTGCTCGIAKRFSSLGLSSVSESRSWLSSSAGQCKSDLS